MPAAVFPVKRLRGKAIVHVVELQRFEDFLHLNCWMAIYKKARNIEYMYLSGERRESCLVSVHINGIFRMNTALCTSR